MQKNRVFRCLLWLATAATLLINAYPILSQSAAPALVVDKNTIGVFTAPRNGLFCKRGKQIGSLKRGEEITEYEEVQAYCGLFLQYPYLRITYKTPDGKSVTGYVHRKDDDGKDRFHVKTR